MSDIRRAKMNDNVLQAIKQKIYNYLKQKNLNADFFMKNMNNNVQNLIVENVVENYNWLMYFSSEKNEIVVDEQFVAWDNYGKPYGFNKVLLKIIEIILGHELVHAAAAYNGYTGIRSIEDNFALNEGLTQMIIENIFGYTVSPNTDSNCHFKKVAKILEATFGEQVILSTYFNHTNMLEEQCNRLAKNNQFYSSLNTHMTTMKNIKCIKADPYYASIALPIYDEMNNLLFQKVCANIIVPKVKTLSTNEERKKYIQNLLEKVKDEQEISEQLADIIVNYCNMDKSELEYEKDAIEAKIANQKNKLNFLYEVYGKNDIKTLVSIDSKGNISPKSNPDKVIATPQFQEKILAELFFKQTNLTGSNKKQFFDNVLRFCENINMNTKCELPKDLNNQLSRKKAFSAVKYAARFNGYIILNSLSEYEKTNSANINLIKLPNKNEIFSFDDLKKVYEMYTIDYESTPNNKQEMVVIDRKSGKKIDDDTIVGLAKFASVWAAAAGVRVYLDEEIPGMEYAFSEQSREVYNQLSKLIKNNMTKTGTIDTEDIEKQIGNLMYKYSKEIISDMFENTQKLRIIYEFYRIQNSDAKTEAELSTPTNSCGYNSNDYYKYKANEVVEQISTNVKINQNDLNKDDDVFFQEISSTQPSNNEDR